MENYIVRIYRREAGDPDHVVGTVECVETRLHKAFHGLRKLGDLLTHAGMLDTDDAGHPSGAAAPATGTIRTGADAQTDKKPSEES